VTSCAQLATILVERLGMKGKPDLLQIAERIGLRVQEVDAEGFDGTLVRAREGRKGIIGIKRSIRENTRKRFTIAHEIGHFLLPGHGTVETICESAEVENWRKGLSFAELEANDFAVELLLPTSFVRDSLRLKDPSFDSIRQVASEFETSLTATTCRLVALTEVPCVVLWSEGKRVKWYKRSGSFPFHLPVEALPTEGSSAYSLMHGAPATGSFVEVAPDSWMDRRDADNVFQVFEHSLRFDNYDAVLTLLTFRLRSLLEEESESTLEELNPEEFTLNRKRWPR
jgi:Zn-dependent peptidase ImmA (M78 family)